MIVEYSVQDLVMFNDELYIVKEVHFMNTQVTDPFMYGIVLAKDFPLGPPIYVRGALLHKSKAIEALYGKIPSNGKTKT